MAGVQAARPSTEVTDRVARRVMARKRLWVWANIALFLVITTIMVLLSMAQRDQDAVRGCRARLDNTLANFKDLQNRGQIAPLNLPLPTPPELPSDATMEERDEYEERLLAERQHYFYNSRYAWRATNGDAVGVACCATPHTLYLRTDGRHVILFDGEHYSLQWLTEEQFQRSAKQFGFPDSVTE